MDIQQKIQDILRTLPDGERISGPDLQTRTQLDARTLYQVIRQMRRNGILVGSSRNGDTGYYEVRDEFDLKRTTGPILAAGFDHIQTVRAMEAAFYEKMANKVRQNIEEEGDDEDE